jgi:transposase
VLICNRVEQVRLGVGIQYPLSDKISRRTLKGCDWKGLLDLIEEVRSGVARALGRPVEVISCYEAGYDGFWLHRQLEAHGVRNYVIDPASLQVNRRARQAKTDRVDAERSLRSLMADLRGEPKVWSVARVPKPGRRGRAAAAPRAGSVDEGARSARQPHQRALRDPWDLRL